MLRNSMSRFIDKVVYKISMSGLCQQLHVTSLRPNVDGFHASTNRRQNETRFEQDLTSRRFSPFYRRRNEHIRNRPTDGSRSITAAASGRTARTTKKIRKKKSNRYVDCIRPSIEVCRCGSNSEDLSQTIKIK